jgi:glutamyl-Q tRNA(Asp) synthetase
MSGTGSTPAPDALETDASSGLAGPNSYVGRFAPSPTGPLHAGSVATALASWLDARAGGGQWLLRIEDIDPPRERPGAIESILSTLQGLGLHWDGEPLRQSTRGAHYEAALRRLENDEAAYPCGCSRREIADSQARTLPARGRHLERPYPGTCRHGLAPGRGARSWRLRVPEGVVRFDDRLHGPQSQDVAAEVGDFVLRRADGLWAYQLAVVVDDAAQGVTDVVRGADLLGATARQIVLARALRLPVPRYMHLPIVVGADGEKLSKQNGAAPVDLTRPTEVLGAALRHLGIEPPGSGDLALWLAEATRRWRRSDLDRTLRAS